MSPAASDYPKHVSKPVQFSSRPDIETVLAVMDELQMIAWEHASQLQVAFAELAEQNQMWVLARLLVDLPAPLPDGRELTLVTWPVGLDKRLAHREFKLLDGETVIARALSSWSVLDKTTRSAMDMHAVLDGHLPSEIDPQVVQYDSRVLPKVKTVNGSVKVEVSEDDIDINGHVNNLRYLAWAVQALPVDWVSTHRLARVDIMFRAECFAGEQLRADWAEAEDGRRLHSLTSVTHGREVARLTTDWKPL